MHKRHMPSITRIKKMLLSIICILGISISVIPFAQLNIVSADTVSSQYASELAKFPKSYQSYLAKIHEQYPNYVFIADYIDYDFDEVAQKEYVQGKVISTSWESSWKDCGYDNYDWQSASFASKGGYTRASLEVIKWYLDPRNFLNSDRVYAFAVQTYTGNETIDTVRSILKGSFMESGYTSKSEEEDADDAACGGDYAAAIMKAAQATGVSPYVIAGTILQEQGKTVTELVSGTYEGADGTLKGYYNFFNWGATDGTYDEIVQSGLTKAKELGWTSVYKAIEGGAEKLKSEYYDEGQYTYYYMDYNVVNMDSLWHQYATHAPDPYLKSISGLGEIFYYKDTKNNDDMKDAALVFHIPVYNNMPAEAAEKPVENDSLLNNYYILDLTTNGSQVSSAFDPDSFSYDLYTDEDIYIYYVLPKGASYIGDTELSVTDAAAGAAKLTVLSQTGYTRTYNISIHSSAKVKVYIEDYSKRSITGISLDKSSAELATGDSLQLNTSLTPTGVSGDITWSSSDESVAKVDANGKVSAVGYGRAVITASANGGKCSASCTIQTRFYDVIEALVNDGTITQGNYTRIYWAADNGIVKGAKDESGTIFFNTKGETTRAQMAIMLYRLAGLIDPQAAAQAVQKGKSISSFTDIAGKSEGIKEAVYWAAGAGITVGYTEKDGTRTYRPDDSISRASTIIMLYRMAGKPGISSASSTGFTDVEGVIDRSRDTYKAIAWAKNKGITLGVEQTDGTYIFDRESNIQRQQMVTFIYRYWTGLK